MATSCYSCFCWLLHTFMVKELEYLQSSIRDFGKKLEELRLSRHAVVNRDSSETREKAQLLIQEVQVTAKDIAFRLNILHEGKDKERLSNEFRRQEARMAQSIRLLNTAMQKPIKTYVGPPLLEEEAAGSGEGQLLVREVQEMDPTSALRQVSFWGTLGGVDPVPDAPEGFGSPAFLLLVALHSPPLSRDTTTWI